MGSFAVYNLRRNGHFRRRAVYIRDARNKEPQVARNN